MLFRYRVKFIGESFQHFHFSGLVWRIGLTFTGARPYQAVKTIGEYPVLVIEGLYAQQ